MIKIVFDNATKGSLWGFSLYIKELGLLFDTGSNGRVLLKNLQKEGVDIKDIRYLFISHSHWDHIGGIDSILELNPDITMFVPNSLSKHLIKDLKTLTKEVIVCEGFAKLFDGVYTTGVLGEEMPEQSLVIDTKEPILITGCGHFGVDRIVKVAKNELKSDISVLIGGFHLLSKSPKEVQEIANSLKNLGVKKVVPTHCTGEKAFKIFQGIYGEDCLKGGIGKSFNTNNI